MRYMAEFHLHGFVRRDVEVSDLPSTYKFAMPSLPSVNSVSGASVITHSEQQEIMFPLAHTAVFHRRETIYECQELTRGIYYFYGWE